MNAGIRQAIDQAYQRDHLALAWAIEQGEQRINGYLAPHGHIYWIVGTLVDGSKVDKIGRSYHLKGRIRRHQLRTFVGAEVQHTIPCQDIEVVEYALLLLFTPFRTTIGAMREVFHLPPQITDWLLRFDAIKGNIIAQACIDYLDAATNDTGA